MNKELSQSITLTLETLEQIQYLAHDLHNIGNTKERGGETPTSSLDKSLQSLLNATELEAKDITKVIDLMRNYHDDPTKQDLVNADLEKFEKELERQKAALRVKKADLGWIKLANATF